MTKSICSDNHCLTSCTKVTSHVFDFLCVHAMRTVTVTHLLAFTPMLQAQRYFRHFK